MRTTLGVILLREASRWGLRIERRGDALAVMPKGKCPPEFKELLRQHKAEILDLLEAKAANLPPDQAPWLHVAKQVLAGEFDGADGSTRESITIGLRSIAHPVCRQALQRLGVHGGQLHE
jgi:hypothetical protein